MIPYVAIGQTLIYFDLEVAEGSPAAGAGASASGGAPRRRAARFGAVRILAFSDLHRDLDQAAQLVEMSAEADVVIGAGDFASIHEGLDRDDRGAGRRSRPRRSSSPATTRPRTRCARRRPGGARRPSCTERATEIDGVEFFGLGAGIPVTPWDWSFDLDEEAAAERLAPCPEGAVLVLHSPPRGYCDTNGSGDHFGSEALLRAIEEKQPRLAVCGHIHESWGCERLIGQTPVRNLGPTGTWIEP